MAETIKGINVVIGADTTGLSKALADVNKKSRDIQSELKQVERLLKLDPSNTELLAQKQKLLGDAVANTREKLDRLRVAQEQVNAQFARGEISEGQYRAFQREVAKTEQELRGLEKQLSEVTGEVTEQGKQVSKLGQDYKEAFAEAERSMGNTFDQLKKAGTVVTAAGAGIAAGLGVAVSKAADFEQGMANAFSVMAPDEVANFRDELKNLALVMGADTKYSATEAARGIEELVKAGVSVQDILNGGLSGALSLATAGELELADAAEIASTALNAFKDDAISVQDAADILAGAANASATSVGELKFGLSQVSAVASGVGLSFEDTVTALAAFAQNGLKGSDAGTSLKTMLMRLTPTTDDAAAEFERLGLYSFNAQKALQYLAENGVTPASTATKDIVDAMMTYSAELEGVKVGTDKANKAFNEMAFNSGAMSSAFYDSNGNLKSMAEIADILQNALKGMTAEQRQVTLNTLFGSDAIRAANILYKEGADGINAMAEAMGKISAADVATQKMNTFKGAMEELSGSLETAQISIGTALIPVLRTLTGVIQAVVDGFNNLPPGVQSAVAVIGALTAALALVGGPLLMLVGFLPQIAAGFAMITPVVSTVGAAMTALAGPVGIAIAAIAGLAAAAFLIVKNWEPIKGFFINLWEGVKVAFSAVWEWMKSFFMQWAEVIAILNPFFGVPLLIIKYWDEIKAGLSAVWEWIKERSLALFNSVKDGITKIWDGIKLYFEGAWKVIKNIFAGALLLIIDLVTGNFDKLRSDAMAIWSNIKDGFRKIWDGIKSIFSGALDVIRGYVTWAWDTIRSATSNVWDAIVAGIQKAIDWIKGLPSTLAELGKNMIQGLVDGIKSMIGKVGDAVKSVADKVTGGLRNLLDIRSPSRVLMQLGEYTGEGFVRGLEKTVDAVRREAAEMAAAVTGGLRGLSAPSVAVAGGGAAVAAPSTINMDGLFAGATIVVRSDEDIYKIAEELGRMQQNAMRRAGMR